MKNRFVFLLALVLLMPGHRLATAQPRQAESSKAEDFIGTWAVEMTEPMKGTQTVRIWERNGALAASVGNGTSQATDVTGIVRDGNMMVLTISRDGTRPIMENGVPIWAVYALTLEGGTMKVALMLERSQTIKRGFGKKQ